MRERWRAVFTALVLALALGVAACGDDEEEPAGGGESTAEESTPAAEEVPAGSTMAKIQEAGKIRIGVKDDVPPFGFKNPQSGDVEGFDVDFGKAVAEKLGVEPELVEAISDNRIPFIQDGTVDLVLSTMTINAERAQEIGFTNPYFIAKGRILVPKDSDIKGVEDLAGKKVCTALGSTYEETLKTEAPDADLRLVDAYSECLELLQNGAVDAISTDDVILTGMIIQDDTLEMVGDPLTTEPYGVGIKDGEKQLKDFVDGVLQSVEEDGRWEETYQEWVGRHIGREEQPPEMTLQEALELGT